MRCKGCFNSQIWEPSTGKPFTDKTIEDIITYCKFPWCQGLSILGGEPTADYNIESAILLAKRFKAAYPEKDIWLWSGRLKEDIENLPKGNQLLSLVDVLVDGPFIEELKSLDLKWKGSSNQRIWRKTNKEFLLTNE